MRDHKRGQSPDKQTKGTKIPKLSLQYPDKDNVIYVVELKDPWARIVQVSTYRYLQKALGHCTKLTTSSNKGYFSLEQRRVSDEFYQWLEENNIFAD